jgi:hypothetical protein
MADHDVGIGHQRHEAHRVALVGEDLGRERRFHLGEDAWRDRRGEPTEKQRFHAGLSRDTAPPRSYPDSGRGSR